METLAPRTGSAGELRAAFEQLQELTRIMTAAPCPVISVVHGYAIGGGAEIALGADLVIGGPSARMRFPEVTIGHAPTGGITSRLPLMVGVLRAKEILMTGRWIEPHEGLAIGLYTEIADDPHARAYALAALLASNPRRSQASLKKALELALVPNQETNLQMEIDLAAYCFESAEAEESFVSFRHRRRDP